MKKQHSFIAYLLIGLGIYFLMKQLKVPIFTNFYSWPTLLIIVGAALLLHSRSSKDDQNLFGGTILLGLGIHFHGLAHYSFWVEHWAVYPLIVGIAFFIRYLRTKKGLLNSLLFIGFSLLMIFSIEIPSWLQWIYQLTDLLEMYWPVAIIILGIYLLKKK